MLDQERKLYMAHLEEWAGSHAGKFVVIKGDAVVGFFDTLDEALAAGAARFGLTSFLARRVGDREETVSIPALTLGLLRAHS